MHAECDLVTICIDLGDPNVLNRDSRFDVRGEGEPHRDLCKCDPMCECAGAHMYQSELCCRHGCKWGPA